MTKPQKPDPTCAWNEPETFEVIESAVLKLWSVVDGLTQIRPPTRDRYRVTIFGSARLQPSHALYGQVRHLASELTKMGCDIITGGGPGLMQAANEGSVVADPDNQTQSIGIRVDLASEQQTNPFVEQVYQHRTFFTRLHHFVLLSDAFVIVPGGIGTTLEAMMIWQLRQVQELHDAPFILVGQMWADFLTWAQQHMIDGEFQMANQADFVIPQVVPTVEEAIALLNVSQSIWRSTI